MKKILLILAMVLFAVQAWGADYKIYISSTTDLSEDGSIEHPYDSFADIDAGDLTALNAAAVAGDSAEINLKGGDTFNEQFGGETGFDTDGASGHPIIIQSYGTGQAIIDPTDETYGMYIKGDYITIDNISFVNQPDSALGVLRLSDPDNTIIKNCTFTGTSGIYGTCNNTNIADNTFNECSAGGLIYMINDCNQASGTSVIQRNTFTNCITTSDSWHGDGHMIGLGGGIVDNRPVKHFTIKDNVMIGCGYNSGGAAIAVYNTEDVDISNNIIQNGNQLGITIDANCKDINIIGNVVANNNLSNTSLTGSQHMVGIYQSTGGVSPYTIDTVNIIGNTIANNSSYFGTAARIALRVRVANVAGYTIQNVTIKNNIISENFLTGGTYGHSFLIASPNDATYTNFDIDYNNYYQSSNTDYFLSWYGTNYSVAEWTDYKTASSQDAHSITTNPRVTSTGKLYHNSPCKASENSGTAVAGANGTGTTDMWGNAGLNGAIPIGAYYGEGMTRRPVVLKFGTPLGRKGMFLYGGLYGD